MERCTIIACRCNHRIAFVVRLCRYGDHASCSENAGCKCKTCKAKALHAQLYPGEGGVTGGTRQERGLDLAFRPGSTDDLPSDARTLLGCAKVRPPDKRIKPTRRLFIRTCTVFVEPRRWSQGEERASLHHTGAHVYAE